MSTSRLSLRPESMLTKEGIVSVSTVYRIAAVPMSVTLSLSLVAVMMVVMQQLFRHLLLL